jgi:hypothetical protein
MNRMADSVPDPRAENAPNPDTAQQQTRPTQAASTAIGGLSHRHTAMMDTGRLTGPMPTARGTADEAKTHLARRKYPLI